MTFLKKHIIPTLGYLPVFAAVVMLMVLTSCDDGDKQYNRAWLSPDKEIVEYTATKTAIQIYSEVDWTVAAEYDDPLAEEWCKLGQTRGRGNDLVVITFSKNEGDMRRVTFVVDFGGNDQVRLNFAQREFYNSAGETVGGWFELPTNYTNTSNKIRVVAHYVPEKRAMRSFTIRYNTDLHYPEWVAYPMHISYHSGGSRTDAWAYDPKIPMELQPNMTHSMQNGYDRGHMIPSASRYINTEANKQTFYGTNMCAQKNALNAGVWATLESKVRQWSGRGTDTLYVVTGAVLRTVGGSESVSEVYSRGDKTKPISVPNYYYKALVKWHSASNTYKGLAFWFNRNDSGDRDLAESDAITIKELEKRTGLTFFPQLPESVVEAVKSNRTDWGL